MAERPRLSVLAPRGLAQELGHPRDPARRRAARRHLVRGRPARAGALPERGPRLARATCSRHAAGRRAPVRARPRGTPACARASSSACRSPPGPSVKTGPRHARLAAGARPPREALPRPRRRGPGRVARLPRRAAGVPLLRRARHLPALRRGRRRADALADALRRRPKLLYLTPTFQNPSGVCYPERGGAEVREVLRGLRGRRRRGDPYRDLWFDEAPAPPVVLGHEPARAVYLGKLLEDRGPRPAHRLPARAAPHRPPLRPREAGDESAHQHARPAPALRAARPRGFARHVEGLRREYRARRDALDGGLAASLGIGCRGIGPGGGMFLWARSPAAATRRSSSPTRSRRGSRSCPAASSTRRAKGRPRFASTSPTAPRADSRGAARACVRAGRDTGPYLLAGGPCAAGPRGPPSGSPRGTPSAAARRRAAVLFTSHRRREALDRD